MLAGHTIRGKNLGSAAGSGLQRKQLAVVVYLQLVLALVIDGSEIQCTSSVVGIKAVIQPDAAEEGGVVNRKAAFHLLVKPVSILVLGALVEKAAGNIRVDDIVYIQIVHIWGSIVGIDIDDD